MGLVTICFVVLVGINIVSSGRETVVIRRVVLSDAASERPEKLKKQDTSDWNDCSRNIHNGKLVSGVVQDAVHKRHSQQRERNNNFGPPIFVCDVGFSLAFAWPSILDSVYQLYIVSIPLPGTNMTSFEECGAMRGAASVADRFRVVSAADPLPAELACDAITVSMQSPEDEKLAFDIWHDKLAPNRKPNTLMIFFGTCGRHSCPANWRHAASPAVVSLSDMFKKSLVDNILVPIGCSAVDWSGYFGVCYAALRASIASLPESSLMPQIRPAGFDPRFDGTLKQVADVNKTIILALVNEGFWDVVFNFDCSLARLGITNIIYYAVDERSAQALAAMNGLYASSEAGRQVTIYYDPHAFAGNYSGRVEYRDKTFMEIMWKRLYIVRDLLQKGYNVLLSDTDIVFANDPRRGIVGDADLEWQVDLQSKYFLNKETAVNVPQGCGGFMFFRASRGAINMIDSALATKIAMHLESDRVDDQDSLNIAAWSSSFSCYRDLPMSTSSCSPWGLQDFTNDEWAPFGWSVRLLDQLLYINGHMATSVYWQRIQELGLVDQVMIIHANGRQPFKREFLNAWSAWLLGRERPTCDISARTRLKLNAFIEHPITV